MPVSGIAYVEDALREISPILPALGSTFVDALQWARHQQEDIALQAGQSQRFYEANYFPNAVRYYFLSLGPLNTHLRTCRIAGLANNGINMVYKDWYIKLLKSTSTRHVPTGTKAVRLLYQTILSSEFAMFHPKQLLILWHADSKGVFLGLSLVYGVNGKLVQAPLQWQATLPHPITIEDLQFLIRHDEDDEDSGDLPFERETDTKPTQTSEEQAG